MSAIHFKLYRFTGGTRIAAASKARAEEMFAAGMRDVADVLIGNRRPSLIGVVDERAESCSYFDEQAELCAYYVGDTIRAT